MTNSKFSRKKSSITIELAMESIKITCHFQSVQSITITQKTVIEYD